MSDASVESILDEVRQELELSRETQRDLLEEIRAHLEDAVADARAAGLDEAQALRETAARFGVRDVGHALQTVHAPWESADAIVACALPVLAALILRWLIFAPDGTVLGWDQMLVRPAFWVVAVCALLIPLLRFNRWRYALVAWGLFWALSVVFVAFPAARYW